MEYDLTTSQFRAFADLIKEHTGIEMQARKKTLVAGRLSRRLRALGCSDYGEYLDRLMADGSGEELEILIDLVTTHVTHFFREPEHFGFLGQYLQKVEHFPFRVWCSAVSTGEEAYSAALVLMDHLGAGRWEILGTDVSAGSIARARAGLYPMVGSDQIPSYYRKKFCLKGRESMDGYFTFMDSVRTGIRFELLNLTDFERLPGGFSPDLIILRNVMIYFDRTQQQRILDSVSTLLKPGGLLMVGHSESLATFRANFRLLQTAVYEKL